MMTAQPLDQWPKWRESLVYHLRMKDIPGDRIGDILLEADAHLRESGESPEDAFGDAKRYAESRTEGVTKTKNGVMIWIVAIGAFAGSFLTVSAALALGRGEGSVLFLPPWLALIAGVLVLAGVLATLPVDLIRHPESNQPLLRQYPAVRYALGVFVAIAAIVVFVLGRFLGV